MPYPIPLFLNVNVLHGSTMLPYQATEKSAQEFVRDCIILHSKAMGIHPACVMYVQRCIQRYVCVFGSMLT
jgi:hypothetical protein